MTCPVEYAEQVDATLGCPFSSANSPIGVWGMNGLGNVFLKEPNSSYHYFNADRGYYYQKANGDEQGHSVYVSPTSERYYNASEAELKPDSHLIGQYWETGKEKVCYKNTDGSWSLTFRKNVETEGLPRHQVAVYIDSLGTHRLVKVNERGIYLEQNQRLIAEIRFWLEHNLPVDWQDGPRLVDDVPAVNRRVTPPPDAPDSTSQGSSNTSSQDPSDSSFSSSSDSNTPSSSGGDDIRRILFPTTYVKVEQSDVASEIVPQTLSSKSDVEIKLGTIEKDVPPVGESSRSGSGRACLWKLFAARKAPEVLQGRITKSTPPVRKVAATSNISRLEVLVGEAAGSEE